MSIYGELDPIPEYRTQFALKDKREHIVKVNIPNIAYPTQHIDIEIPHGSRDHVIIPDTVKITFNLEFKSTDKTRNIVNNVSRTLVKKKVLMLGSRHLQGPLLEGKEREEKLLQGIQSANALKICVGAKKADGTALAATTRENAIKKMFDKGLQYR